MSGVWLALALGAWAAEPKLAAERVVLHTAAGDIVLALYADHAPRHAAQILALSRLGVYDSTHFFRVVPRFHVQLSAAADRGLPLSAEQRAALRPLKAEFNSLRHRRGSLSMARDLKDPDSAESSFSIILGDWPQGDGRYTVFGEVEKGMDVVEQLARVPRGAGNRPETRLEVLMAEAVGAADLARRRLAPARPLAAPGPRGASPAPSPSIPRLLAWGVLVMALISGAAFGLGGRWPGAWRSLCLLNVLVGGFLLLGALAPVSRGSQALAVCLFLGLLGLFRLMSRFEEPER